MMKHKLELRKKLKNKFKTFKNVSKRSGIPMYALHRYLCEKKDIPIRVLIKLGNLLEEDTNLFLSSHRQTHPRIKTLMESSPKSFGKIMDYIEKYGPKDAAIKLYEDEYEQERDDE